MKGKKCFLSTIVINIFQYLTKGHIIVYKFRKQKILFKLLKLVSFIHNHLTCLLCLMFFWKIGFLYISLTYIYIHYVELRTLYEWKFTSEKSKIMNKTPDVQQERVWTILRKRQFIRQ